MCTDASTCRHPLFVGLEVIKIVFDPTQRDYECVLRTGVEGEADQGIFINEAPHTWNVAFKCAIDSCPLFYTVAEGQCSCVAGRINSPSPAVPAVTSGVNPALCPTLVSPLESLSSVSRTASAGSDNTRRKIAVGDVVSVSPTTFDGQEPGSFSAAFPERCYGSVVDMQTNGLASVEWENKTVDVVKLKVLRRELEYQLRYAIY